MAFLDSYLVFPFGVQPRPLPSHCGDNAHPPAWTAFFSGKLLSTPAVFFAGYELDVTPWPVTLASDAVTTISVRLQMPPAADNVVTVLIDSSAAANFYAVSGCSLTFTASNWNVYQNLSIISVLSFTPAASITVGA